jgi:tRNA G18 (ribose-2'-O)-methylase SpoU
MRVEILSTGTELLRGRNVDTNAGWLARELEKAGHAVLHHQTVDDLARWARAERLPLLGIDILPGATPITGYGLPRACVLLFGQEGPGLSDAARALVEVVLAIPQFGSTRSINAGTASGIAMYEWIRQHGETTEAPR